MKKLLIDFEYNGTSEQMLNLVSCAYCDFDGSDDDEVDWESMEHDSVFLHNREDKKKQLHEYLLSKRDTHVFVAFNVIAEGQSLISLGLDPTKFTWIDLQVEWRMLTNHCDEYGFGKQLIKGEVVTTERPPPFWMQDEMDYNATKRPGNLAGAIYKMLGVKIDTVEKDQVRDLIISSPATFSKHQRKRILEYGLSDIHYLHQLEVKLRKAIKVQFNGKYSLKHAFTRGQTVADTALMSARGYPVNYDALWNLSKNVNKIYGEIAEHINEQFPDLGIFYKKKDGYSMKRKPIQEWIENSYYKDNWLRTKTGYSLSEKQFSKHFSFRHDYPVNNLPAQIMRYYATNSALRSIKQTEGRDSFFDYVGNDHRSRPYLNPYGSATGRWQPQSRGFLPLKSAWLRSMIVPKKGRGIISVDYGQQEFFIAALLSRDRKMAEAYLSGDPYLYFGKAIGSIPEDADKSHPLRGKFKSSILGIQFLMGAKSLGKKITMDTGVFCSTEEADQIVRDFFVEFEGYDYFLKETRAIYREQGYLMLKDGWACFGDNDNHRSVSNFPMQGTGGVCMRKLTRKSTELKLPMIFSLHDAGNWEIDFRCDEEVDDVLETIERIMREAFAECFDGKVQNLAYKRIRMDCEIYGPGLEGKEYTFGGETVVGDNLHIDKRSQRDYEKFKKYM